MRKEEEQVFSNESQMTKMKKVGELHEEHATLMKPHEEWS